MTNVTATIELEGAILMRPRVPGPATRTRRTTALEPKLKEPSYEDRLAESFVAAGFRVMDYTAWKKCKSIHSDPNVVVRQFKPSPYDPETGKNRAYQMDFAVPALRCNLEFDGFRGFHSRVGGHTNWDGFHRDRHRDRLLVMEGWRVLRFGPDDINRFGGPDKAVGDFKRLLSMVKGECDGGLGGS